MLRSFLFRSLIKFIFFFPIFCCSGSEIIYAQTNPDSLFNKALGFYNMRDYDLSLYYFNESAEYYKNQGDSGQHSRCLLYTGRIYFKLDNLAECIKFYNNAESQVGSSGKANDLLISDILHEKGKLYFTSKDFEKANENYIRSIELRLEHNIEDTVQAKSYNNLGLGYRNLGDLNRAEYFINLAIDLKEKILGSNHILIARSYVNLGGIYDRLGIYEDALKLYNKAEQIYIRLFGRNHRDLGAIYHNKGIIYNQNRDYEQAQYYYYAALKIYEGDYNKNLDELLLIFNSIGKFFYNSRDFDKALEYFQRGMAIALRNDPRTVPDQYIELAFCNSQMGYINKAEEYYSNAIDMLKHYYSDSYFKLTSYYLNYGNFYLNHKNDINKAYNIINHALELNLKNFGLKHYHTSACYHDLGHLHFIQEDYARALQNFQKAIIASTKNFNDTSIYANPDNLDQVLSGNNLLNALTQKASALHWRNYKFKNLKDLKASLLTYELKMKLVEKMKSGYQTKESKLGLSETVDQTYGTAISIAFQLYEKTGDIYYKNKAFEFSEKSKSAILLSSIRDIGAKEFGGIPSNDLEYERELKVKMSSYEGMIYEENRKEYPDRKKISLMEDIFFGFKLKYDSITSYFEKTYAEYYSLKFDTEVIEVEKIQSGLTENDVMIEYIFSYSGIFIFVITPDAYEIYKQLYDSTFFEDISTLQELLVNNDFSYHTIKMYKKFIRASNNLSQTLINPFFEILKGKNVYIIPDNQLAYIPFELLLTQQSDSSKMNYKGLPYLINDAVISYSYSATLLFDMPGKKRLGRKGLLAFAPAYEERFAKTSSQGDLRRSYPDILDPIPGVKEEVEDIVKRFWGRVFMDEDATESSFKIYAGLYDMLHLAMHTIIDNENPMYSKLVFTAGDSIEDGYLNTWEIYNLVLKARLAVLSSCSSGSGKIRKGEGVMSLARSFLYAGCPSILMTLWDIEDNSGSLLILLISSSLQRYFFLFAYSAFL